MYSPKIHDSLIPSLYRIAKIRKMPMTRLVNQAVSSFIELPDNQSAEQQYLQQKEKKNVHSGSRQL